MPAVPLANKKVLVMGLGRFGGGVGVSQWLEQQGAIVTVNAEPADVEPDGSFKKTITIERDGYSMLVIKAVDAAGNETVKPLKVFVESL